MKKFLLASVAALTLIAAAIAPVAPVAAFQWNIVGGGFGAIGGSFSNVNNFAGSTQFGSSSATGQTQGFAKAESAIGYGVGLTGSGAGGSAPTNAGTVYGNFVGGTAATGSLSNGTSSTSGNGFSSVDTGGTSSAGTGVIGIGGFVSAP